MARLTPEIIVPMPVCPNQQDSIVIVTLVLNHECALVSNHLATCTVSRMRACLVAMSYAQLFSKSPITLDSGRIVASPA